MGFDAEVVIAGSGITGSVLALALSREGVTTLVVNSLHSSDRLSPEFDGRAYAMSLSSRRLLESVGLWEALRDNCQEIAAFEVSDGRPGEGAGFGAFGIDLAETGETGVWQMVEDRHLRSAVSKALAKNGRIRQIAPDRITGHEARDGDMKICLDSGRSLSAYILAGCDGRDGRVASNAGIGRTGKDYGQSAIVCAVQHERPHDGVAHQLFMPAGPLAILPLKGNRSSIVWTEQSANARRIASLDDGGFLGELRPRFGEFLGRVTIAGPRFVWPLRLSIADSLVAKRVVLVGDAARAVHPLAGQGLNLGLRDVAALAEVIVLARRRGEDLGSLLVLERYQRWRRFDSVSLALLIDGLNSMFSNDGPFLRLARGAGMLAVNELPWFRQALARESAGLTGDVPRLMLGLSI